MPGWFNRLPMSNSLNMIWYASFAMVSLLITFLYFIEDNASANKEENLAVSAIDTETNHRKDGDCLMVTPFIFTTNMAMNAESESQGTLSTPNSAVPGFSVTTPVGALAELSAFEAQLRYLCH